MWLRAGITDRALGSEIALGPEMSADAHAAERSLRKGRGLARLFRPRRGLRLGDQGAVAVGCARCRPRSSSRSRQPEPSCRMRSIRRSPRAPTRQRRGHGEDEAQRPALRMRGIDAVHPKHETRTMRTRGGPLVPVTVTTPAHSPRVPASQRQPPTIRPSHAAFHRLGG